MSDLKTFGELEVGDMIPGPNGPVQVIKVYDEHIPEEMFRLTFEDKKRKLRIIDASSNHLWYIETKLDKELHRKRVKDGLRLFSDLIDDIEPTAFEILEVEGRAEVALTDMIQFMDANTPEKIKAVVRVAESIGHIIEEKTMLEDFESGTIINSTDLRLYDGKRFVQQLLSLASKSWAKDYPLIVGRVVTTGQLSMLAMMNLDIPEIREAV